MDSKISVVTVVKNQKDKLPATLASVLSQSYPHVEYVVIDGGSSDGSVEVIMDHLDGSGFRHRVDFFESKSDGGLYFAMNRSLEIVSGDFVCFMNAGDRFYDDNVLESIFSGKAYSHSVIYGTTQIIYDDNHKKLLGVVNHDHRFHHNFIHQSSFVRTSVMKEYGFDTRFRIAADTNFFTTVFNGGHSFLFVDQVISCFDASGISSRISVRMFMEDLIIGQKYSSWFFIRHIANYVFDLVPRFLAKKIIPDRFLNRVRMMLSRDHL